MPELFIRPFSDLHLECRNGWYDIPFMQSDGDTILVLAGDIFKKRYGVERKHIVYNESFFENLASRFKHVVMVLGNHDYWDDCIDTAPVKLKTAIAKAGLANFHVLNNESIILDGVRFIGGTLWTDFDKHNPLVTMQATGYMTDYRKIRIKNFERRLTVNNITEEHSKTVSFIKDELSKPFDGKSIVITHHGPSMLSRDINYQLDYATHYYVSDLSNLIDKYKPDMWFHGHVHCPISYQLYDTYVVANPVGYPGERQSCNPNLRYTIKK